MSDSTMSVTVGDRRTRTIVGASAALLLALGGSLALAAPAHAAPAAFFPTDAATLAIFEFNGDVLDSSGNGRHATLLDPAATFTTSTYGQGLVLPDAPGVQQGIDWTPYASLLTAPYTVEVLVQPDQLVSWSRLFTHDRNSDDGLYYLNGTIQNYPDAPLSGVELDDGTLHCLAWSAPAEPANVLDLYLDGELLGQVNRTYTTPTDAWFFNDNTSGGATDENILGHVDAMRISSVARTGAELAATCEAAGAGVALPPVDAPAAAAPQLTPTGADPAAPLLTGGILAIGGLAVVLGMRRRGRAG